jgi:protein disulfide-isomerase A6
VHCLKHEPALTMFLLLSFTQMFPKGSSDKKSETYMQSRSEEDLINYLNSKCMTFRTVGGALSEMAGRMPLLDTLASRFFMAKQGDERQSVWEEAKQYVERQSQGANATVAKNTAANYYLKVSDTVDAEGCYV